MWYYTLVMRDTIKSHRDFITPEDGPIAKSPLFIIKLKEPKFPDDPRYGIRVTKRTFKHAVQRNRAKRLLRDWIRANQTLLLEQYDYIFIARTAIIDATRDMGRESMRKALHYLYVKYGKKKKSAGADGK